MHVPRGKLHQLCPEKVTALCCEGQRGPSLVPRSSKTHIQNSWLYSIATDGCAPAVHNHNVGISFPCSALFRPPVMRSISCTWNPCKPYLLILSAERSSVVGSSAAFRGLKPTYTVRTIREDHEVNQWVILDINDISQLILRDYHLTAISLSFDLSVK